MKKLIKIIFVCLLCIGLVRGNEGVLQADVNNTFTAKISVGGTEVDAKFKILSEGVGEAKGTVQIGTGENYTAAINTSTAGAMTLPEVVTNQSKTYTVTKIGSSAFNGCTALTSTGLESNVTIESIGDNAFYGCTFLKSTGLASNDTIKSIESDVFNRCTSLTSTGLASNETIESIGDYAFMGCESLTSTGLENNDTIERIGNYAFYNCTTLISTGLESNDTIKSIGNYAFGYCESLKSTGLENNDTIKSIGEGAFFDCTALTSTGLENNNTIESIGEYAFGRCAALKSTGLSTNSKVASIGDYTFLGCDKLTIFIFKNKDIPTIGARAFPSNINIYYFEGAINTDRLNGYSSTKIKVNTIELDKDSQLAKTYHEGETFIPKGLKFRVGYSEPNKSDEVVSDIVDYDKSASEFTLKDVVLKGGKNTINAEYLGKQFSFAIDAEPHTYELRNDEAYHWLQCTKDTAIKDKETHTYGEWIIDKEATISTVGEKHTVCSQCKNKKVESIPVISDTSSYTVTSGSNQTWVKGSKNNIRFTIDANMEKFKDIKIDGELLNTEMYHVTRGSTIIEIKAEYLNTLNKGKHEVVIVFNEKEVNTNFEIIEAVETKDIVPNKKDAGPDTGDQTHITLYISMMIITLGACLWLRKVKN